jgi:hypothetical protein
MSYKAGTRQRARCDLRTSGCHNPPRLSSKTIRATTSLQEPFEYLCQEPFECLCHTHAILFAVTVNLHGAAPPQEHNTSGRHQSVSGPGPTTVGSTTRSTHVSNFETGPKAFHCSMYWCWNATFESNAPEGAIYAPQGLQAWFPDHPLGQTQALLGGPSATPAYVS